MAEPEVRRRLEAIDTNINVKINDTTGSNDKGIVDPAPAAKKAKTTPRILTFSIDHSPVQVQVLSTQTLYDLVDIICRETTIGRGESANAHLWNIRLPGGKVYESDEIPTLSNLRANRTLLADLSLVPKTTTMIFNYDYGAGLAYKIRCEEVNEHDNTTNGNPILDESSFPRRIPAVVPKGYILFETQQVDLNTLFPSFNKWAFPRNGRAAELNLFQAGRKQNYGFVERSYGLRHMLFLPCKAGDDLSVYFHCFDCASQAKYATRDGYAMNSWFSVVVLPEDHPATLSKRYARDLEEGFVETKVVSFPPTIPLMNSVFPKLAALAGYRKDKRVPRGWLTYQNKTLRLCAGASVTPKSPAIKGTAFDGMNQHEPADEYAILHQMEVELESLHHLFCVAEGLLQSRC
jgi:hypothetical protein